MRRQPVIDAREALGAIPLRYKRGFWRVAGYPIMNTDQMVQLARELREATDCGSG